MDFVPQIKAPPPLVLIDNIKLGEYQSKLNEKYTPVLHCISSSECPTSYLNQLKQDLPCDEVIVLGDFAEKSQFILQDEIHGFNWNSSQGTLHPIVIYYKVNNSIQSNSLYFISNDLTPDVDMVLKLLK